MREILRLWEMTLILDKISSSSNNIRIMTILGESTAKIIQ